MRNALRGIAAGLLFVGGCAAVYATQKYVGDGAGAVVLLAIGIALFVTFAPSW